MIRAGYGGFRSEPAFSWQSTSFAYLYVAADSGWHRVNDYTEFSSLDSGERELLRHYIEGPAAYVGFVSEYYELDVPVDLIAHVFSNAPITGDLVSRLNPEVNFEDVTGELYDVISYPK